MGIEEEVIAAAEDVLKQNAMGLTKEALVRLVEPRLTHRLLPTQIIAMLRKQPQRFVEGGDGRWRLREQVELSDLEDAHEIFDTDASPRRVLRRGSYVFFDLETIGRDAGSPDTEIIQIAAWRWVDGVPQQTWATFVHPSVTIPTEIVELTKISMDEVRDAPSAREAMIEFFAYVGDLPLIAHNGASFDGPIITAVCERLGLPVPPTFLVLDTLPLARTLLPLEKEHRVSTLAKRFDCDRSDAHRADADVEMLAGIVQGLEREMQSSVTGAAVYELLHRGDDPWAAVLKPPAAMPVAAEIIATFGANLTPLLPERESSRALSLDSRAVEEVFAQAETLGRTRREAQLELAHLAADTFRSWWVCGDRGGYRDGKKPGILDSGSVAGTCQRKACCALDLYTRAAIATG